MKYKVWTVYTTKTKTLTKVTYIILNTETRKIQSSWSDWKTAVATCSDLNYRMKESSR